MNSYFVSVSIDDRIRDAEFCMKKGLRLLALSYIDRINEQLQYLSESDRNKIHYKYAHFFEKYVQPLGTDGVYDGDET